MYIYKNTILLLLFFFAFHSLFGQIEIDKNIEFDNSDDSLRNVFNIGFPSDSSDALSIRNGSIKSVNYFDAMGTDNQINLVSNFNEIDIKPGLSIIFKPALTNSDSVTVSINSQGNYKLLKYSSQVEELDSADLIADQIVEVLYDGNNFRLISSNDNVCPLGYAEVDESFCIETVSHEPVNFFDASVYCMDRNARLCKWSEFSSACEVLNTASNDFTNTWEWVSASSDHSNGAKIVGNINCENNGFYNAELNFARFRCCYNK